METSQQPRRSWVKSIFLSPVKPRLRAGWRLLLQTILFLFLLTCGSLPFVFISSGFQSEIGLLLLQLAELFAVTLSVFLARRFLDKGSITSLGLRLNLQALIDLVIGFLITIPMMGLIYFILWAAGWLTFEGFAWQTESLLAVTVKVILAFAAFVIVGWNEELLCRGYQLQALESGLNTFWGVLISSAIFGLMHLNNPNADSIWPVFSGIFLAGIFLAFGYLRTRQLWLPIGLHLGWNFFEGVVFSFPVSGLDISHLLHITIDGPKLWTGGAFGPEAGLVLIPGMGLGLLLVFLYTKRRRIDRSEL